MSNLIKKARSKIIGILKKEQKEPDYQFRVAIWLIVSATFPY